MINWLLCLIIGHKLAEAGHMHLVGNYINGITHKPYVKLRCYRCGKIVERDR